MGELEREYPSAAACLAEDLPALCVWARAVLHVRLLLAHDIRGINIRPQPQERRMPKLAAPAPLPEGHLADQLGADEGGISRRFTEV